MAEHIVKRLCNGRCVSLLEFISSSVYESPVDHHQFMERAALGYESFLAKIFVSLPPQAYPDKLTSRPAPMKEDFHRFYSCPRFMYSCRMFTEKIFPKLVWENPLTPMFSMDLWNALYAHIGDCWLNFIFCHSSIFVGFPKDCLLQVTGKTVHDQFYEAMNLGKAKRKSQFEDASGKKRLKPDAGVANAVPAPPVSFRGVRLTVEMNKLLYSKNLAMAFPRFHDLEKLSKADPVEAGSVIKLIFQGEKSTLKSATSVEFGLKASTVAFLNDKPVKEIMRSFLRNHRKVHFLEMLLFHCPFDRNITTTTTKSYCSPQQVVDFLNAIIHRVFPLELFGSKHNKCKMQDFCKHFVNSSKGDCFSLEQLLYCMRVEDCRWISGIAEEEQRQITFAILMNWLFSDYLLTVLRGFFYVTEFEGEKKRLFFYRKDVWDFLRSQLTTQLLRSNLIRGRRFKIVSDEPEMNFGHLSCTGAGRLLPKKTYSRLILNLKLPSSLSTCLRNYLCVLNYVMDREFAPQNFLAGYSVPSLQDFHKVWQKFVESHRTDGKLVCPDPLYFVKLDIQNCFSSVKLDLLAQVLEDACRFVGRNGVQEVDVYTCFIMSMANGRVRHQYRRIAVPKDGCILEQLIRAGHCGQVLVDLKHVTTISIPEMTQALIFHLKNITVELGEHTYALTQGLGQGSLLSPILSNLYCGHMEGAFLREFSTRPENRELLVRYVDDYFFVGPEKERAQEFLSALHPGIPQYNCGTSCAKVVTNFDDEPHKDLDVAFGHKKSDLIPWLGLLIDSKTLEITGDFSHFAGQSVAHTMTLDAALGRNGLRKKVTTLVAPGNQCILFDKKVNGKKTIVKNLYEYSLLMCFRMHSLSTKLSKSDGADKHPGFYAEMIVACVNQICLSLCKLRRNHTIVYPLKNCVSKWICLQAFIAKLKRHAMKYHEVLKTITQKSKDLARKIGPKETAYFRRAIGPRMPQVFREMQV